MYQLDTDSYLTQNITFNMVEFLRGKDIFLTNNREIKYGYEIRVYNMGLPELARYWMTTRGGLEGLYVTAENISASGKRYIAGSILKHCRPADITGLHTCSADACSPDRDGWTGWDGHMFSGNNQIFSLDHWFTWEIQDFVQMVLQSGGHIEHRWVDISTHSMIRHMFTPDEKIHILTDIDSDHGHGRNHPKCLPCSDWMQ